MRSTPSTPAELVDLSAQLADRLGFVQQSLQEVMLAERQLRSAVHALQQVATTVNVGAINLHPSSPVRTQGPYDPEHAEEGVKGFIMALVALALILVGGLLILLLFGPIS